MTAPHRGDVHRLVRVFGPHLWARRSSLASSYVFRVLEVALGVLAPWPLKLLIDDVLSDRPLPDALGPLGRGLSTESLIILLAAAILAITALRAGADALQKLIGARIRELVSLELRDRMLSHVQTLPPTVRTSHRSGELVLRMVGDVDLFVRLQTKVLPTIFEAAFTIVATLAMMFYVEPRVAWLSLLLLPFFTVLVRHYGRRLGAASREKRREEGEVAGLAQEIVRGLPSIQALGAEARTRERFAGINARSLRAGVRETSVAVSMEQVFKIAHGVAVAAIVGFGAHLVRRGALTIGDLTVLTAYIVQLLKPIERLNDLAETTSRGLAAGERLLRLLDLQPAVRDLPHAVTLTRARGVIEMRDVWFRYPPMDQDRGPVLRGVSLRLEPGCLTVLLGASGAGKSTVLALLHRLFDPARGVILLDDRPLPEISLRSLRAQIAPMGQDTHLFAGTIRDALSALATPAGEARLWQALELVGLDEFIASLPRGLDTRLGEDGINVSGGERQRLSLARAFLLDRPILLLDEPVSNVDAASAAIIAAALLRLKRDRTCLAVTHRLSLLDHADVIYRLDEGVVADITGHGAPARAGGRADAMTACAPLQPRDVFCVIERLHRSRATAEEVVAGRYTHQGVTVVAGRNPDWLGSTLPADREWALEWRKCYFGLDLASAFRETGDPRFVEAWVRAVRSFIEQVPIELDTSDVTARRIQNWIYAWNGFRRANVELGEDVAGELLASLQRQVVRLRQHLTRERNHRTLELYALFIAALALPQIDHGAELLDFSIRELCANLRADMRADGTHRESSTHYHMVVLRSFVGLRQNAHQFGLRLADDFDARLALACEFAMHCHRPDGCIPALSDSDSGSYLDVLELAGELLGREDFLYVGSRGQRGRPPAIANVGFRDGGYFVQRSGWTGKAASGLGERFLIFDCGPLGDGGHGHYDLLNVEIAAGDRPLVVDPGRYTYLDAPVPWRRWFKGTPAHNTVSVDDLDQTFYFRGKPKAAVAQGRWLGRTTAEGLDMLWGEVQSPCYDAVHRRRILFVANEYLDRRGLASGRNPSRLHVEVPPRARGMESDAVPQRDGRH